MSEMEIRSHEFEVRLEAETRTVSGIAVPYGQTIDLGGYQERVAPGAFDTSKTVPLFFGHEHRSIPIGKVTAMRDTPQGLEIDAKLNDTSQANDVYAALRAGDLNKFSIGFVPIESRDENGVTVRVRADLKEVSVVTFPAYSGAEVSMVREDTNNNSKEKEIMSDNDYSNDVAELRDSVADLERKFDRFTTEDRSASNACAYETGGEWIKGLLRGESAAKSIATRAFDGATTVEADVTRPAWVSKALHIVEKQRVIKGLFSSAPLPASGNSIEYPFVKSVTGTVGVQAAEGDNLSYLELAVDTATAQVKTYGGYSSISRQAIERSDVAYLDAVLRMQTIAYANATEKAVQDTLVATYNATVGPTTANKVAFDLDGGDASDWLAAVIDAKAAIDTNSAMGLQADFILISRDVHKKLTTLTDLSGRPVFAINGDGANTFGNLPGGRLAGVIDGTPVVVGKNLTSGTVIVASAQALTSYESSGAPIRLQDENVIALTKDFSVHGYMAIATPDVKAITFLVDDGVS